MADVKKCNVCCFSGVFVCRGCYYLEGVSWLAEEQVILQCFRTHVKRLRGTSGQQRKVQLTQPPSIKRSTPHDRQHSTSCATLSHTTISSFIQQRGQDSCAALKMPTLELCWYDRTIHQHFKITDARILECTDKSWALIKISNYQLPIISIILMHIVFCGRRGLQYDWLRTHEFVCIWTLNKLRKEKGERDH